MGDEAAFADFVRAHSRSLFTTAYLLTGRSDRAEDLLQDTLTHLFPRWGKVVAAQAPLAYVRRALTNRFLDAARSAPSDIAMWELPDSADTVDLAAGVTDRRLLWQLLGTLPERQRAAIVLRYLHDQTDQEIARVLGCRDVTVRSLVSRGVATMREHAACSENTGGDQR